MIGRNRSNQSLSAFQKSVPVGKTLLVSRFVEWHVKYLENHSYIFSYLHSAGFLRCFFGKILSYMSPVVTGDKKRVKCVAAIRPKKK